MINNEYQSCCYRIDKQFAMFIIGVIIVVSTMALSIYKLIVEKSCESASPYYSLLSSTSGIATGVVFSHATNKRNIRQDSNQMASI